MDQRVKVRLGKESIEKDFDVLVVELEKQKALVETVKLENAHLNHALCAANRRIMGQLKNA